MRIFANRYRDFISVVLLGGLAVVFYIQMAYSGRYLARNASDALIRDPNISTREMVAAMAWLKENSRPDDVVLAPQKLGHAIVAFADRPVIVSTKIYPSEVPEVAERFRDLASFFFATDMNDAMRVLDKYSVKFVMLSRDMEYGLCEEADACHFVGGDPRPGKKRELNPEGRKRTMLGWLQEKDEVPGFTKIWSSDRFDIWRLTSKTQPALCEFSEQEKRMILSSLTKTFVRGGSDRTYTDLGKILQQRCNVSVWAIADGAPKAQSIVTGRSLGDALQLVSEELRAKLTNDPAMPRARFLVSLWHEDQVYPVSNPALSQSYPDAFSRGYRYGLKDDPTRYYFFPVETNFHKFVSSKELRRYLCQRVRLYDDCLSGQDTIVESFSTATFMDRPDTGQFLEFAGPLAFTRPTSFDNELLRERLRAALDWFLSRMHKDADSGKDSAPFNALVLAGGFKVFGDSDYRDTAVDILDSWIRKISVEGRNDARDLADAMLASLELGETRKADEYAKWLVALRFGNSDFAPQFSIRNGSAESVVGTQDTDVSRYIFEALAKYYSVTKNETVGNVIKNMKQAVGNQFLHDHIANYDLNVGSNAVLTSAFSALYGVDHDDYDSTMSTNIARWLLEYQNPRDAAGLGGSFWAAPSDRYVSAYNTAKAANALIDGEKIATALGKRRDIYADGIKNAIGWLLSMQYSSDNNMLQLVPIAERAEYRGGIRRNLASIEPSVDSTGRFITAAARYFNPDLL